MPCILLIVVLAFPRVALLLLFFLSSYLERAYHNILILLLGFIFLPLTTLVYAYMVNNSLPIAGLNLLWLLLAALIDLGSLGGGGGRYRRRR
ncbi:MAG: hypothetical protein M3Y27_06830 [Acidobacteriota bacterium]|nr:hypothetical protein [Acidobacteriota bacterium]